MTEFEPNGGGPDEWHSTPSRPGDAGGVPVFCRVCGTPMAGQVNCPVCDDREKAELAQTGQPSAEDGCSVKSAIVLYFVLLSSVAIVFVDPADVVLQMVVGVVDAVIVLAWVLVYHRQIVPLLGLPRHGLRWLAAAALAGCLTYGLTHWFVGALNSLLGFERFRYSDDFLQNGHGLVLLIVFIVLQPAMVEEFAFRGVIFHALRGLLTLKEAVLVSSLMFAALHLSPLAFPHTFLIGVLAAILTCKTGSIWPGVILHLTHNGMVLVCELCWT